jgi:hypothetical protein
MVAELTALFAFAMAAALICWPVEVIVAGSWWWRRWAVSVWGDIRVGARTLLGQPYWGCDVCVCGGGGWRWEVDILGERSPGFFSDGTVYSV